MDGQKEYWNNAYKKVRIENPKYDLWLDKYKDILELSKETPIMDLGCGGGNDSLYLSERGHKVISCDISESALEIVRQLIPGVNTIQMDMLQGLPFKDTSTKVIVADLSLHYFYWKDTVDIVNEIKRVLTPDGYLLCRLNSINDINYGAGQGILLEENYYNIDGKMKRFFNKDHIISLFKDWRTMQINEYQMDRYGVPKTLWEVAVTKEGG